VSEYARDPNLDTAACILPGVVHGRALCALLRIEDQNAQIIALLSEIRDQGKAPKAARKVKDSPVEDSAEVV